MSNSEKVKRYEKIEYLGEGQFATVYKAKDLVTGKIVAVKKIKIGDKSEAKDGINRTALREIKYLQEVKHDNIIDLLDVFGHKSNVSLVFDFMETDLEVIIRDQTIVLSQSNIKSYILMTLTGIEYLHINWILHRDLKPNNLLIDSKGILKIGDFGLAKYYGSPTRLYTSQVVTRWYRCPELLFGAQSYGTGVDIWSIGCILAELLLRLPFMAGETDLDQLTKIFAVLGTPIEDDWENVKSLPFFVEFVFQPKTNFQDIFTAATDDLIIILEWMLHLNPLKRCTATQALKHPYFTNPPGPSFPEDLPMPASNHISSSSLLSLKSDGSSNGLEAKRLVF